MAHREKHRHAALLRRAEQGRTIASDLSDWTPHVPKTKRIVPQGEPNEPYQLAKKVAQAHAHKEFRSEIDAVRNAPVGMRSHQLFLSASKLLNMVARKLLTKDEVAAELHEAARANGMMSKEVEVVLKGA